MLSPVRLLLLAVALLPGSTVITAQTVCTSAPLDLTFIVDQSGSICDGDINKITENGVTVSCTDWEFVLNFTQSIADRQGVSGDELGAQVAMIRFGDTGILDWDLDEFDNNNDLDAAIQALPYDGGRTNTSGGLRVAIDEVYEDGGAKRVDSRKIAILITDGVSTQDRDRTVPDAETLRADPYNVTILAIGITSQIEEDELKAISSEPQELNVNYFTIPDFEDLMSLVDVIDTLLTENRVQCEEIPTTTTTEPTTVTTMEPVEGCDGQMDVVFLVDTSGSIRFKNFFKIMDFLDNLVNGLDIDSGDIRVGMATFANGVELIFHLEDYLTRSEVRAGIAQADYTRGTTNTADGIKYVREDMFAASNGDRAGVNNVLVVLTDGNSNDKEETVAEAMAAKADGIHIVTMALGGWLDEYELRAIASHPWETNLIEAPSYDELNTFVEAMRNFICNNVNECSSDPCENGGTCVDGVGTYWCQCTDQWGGMNCNYRCNQPADVVFAVDASGSIRKENFEMLVDFTKAVAMQLPIDGDARVGLETFADSEKIYFNLKDHDNREAIINAMSLPHFSGGTTNTAAALRALRDTMYTTSNGERDNDDYPNIAIVITDGNSNDKDATWAEAIDTREANVDLLAVGVGSSVTLSELQGIVSYPSSGNVFVADSFSSLNETDLISAVVDTMCNTVNECDQSPCQNGGTCYDMRNGYSCECPSTYTGKNCERECSGEADIVFIIDKSGSIRSERFVAVKEFFVTVIDDLELWDDKVRIGLVSFEDQARVEFYMDSFNSKEDIIQAIRLLSYNGGRTNIAEALQLAREEVFDGSRGDRQDVPNFLILFSDGKANINEADTVPEAILTRIAGTHIISIGVGNDADQFELEAIASDPVAHTVFTVASFNDLPGLQLPLIGATCDDNNECSSNPCQNGGTCADGLSKYVCLCPTDRTGQNCDRRCNTRLDIAFILDFSGSVDEVYTVMLTFVRHVIYGLEFRFDTVRVGIVTFASEAKVSFTLDRYQEKEDVLNALAFRREGGRTNTADALSVTRTEIFSVSGDRDTVPNKVILLTDGGSNVNSDRTISEATSLKDDADADIYVIAIGERVDMDEINEIATEEVRSLEENDDDDVAEQIANELLEDLCNS